MLLCVVLVPLSVTAAASSTSSTPTVLKFKYMYEVFEYPVSPKPVGIYQLPNATPYDAEKIHSSCFMRNMSKDYFYAGGINDEHMDSGYYWSTFPVIVTGKVMMNADNKAYLIKLSRPVNFVKDVAYKEGLKIKDWCNYTGYMSKSDLAAFKIKKKKNREKFSETVDWGVSSGYPETEQAQYLSLANISSNGAIVPARQFAGMLGKTVKVKCQIMTKEDYLLRFTKQTEPSIDMSVLKEQQAQFFFGNNLIDGDKKINAVHFNSVICQPSA